MTETLAIRAGAAADLPVLVAIWADAARVAHPFVPGEGRGARRREVETRFLPRAETLVAEAAGRAVGFAALEGDDLTGLFVRPDRWGQGVGRALLAAASQDRGRLAVTVFRRNERAVGFYRAQGFCEIGRGIDAETAEVALRLLRVHG